MKIRITGKGLPKAQYQNSQIINSASRMPDPNKSWYTQAPSLTGSNMPPLPNITTVGPSGVRTNNGGFGKPTLQFQTYNSPGTPLSGPQAPIVPIKNIGIFKPNWVNKNRAPKWQTAINNTMTAGQNDASGVLNSPTANTLGEIGKTFRQIATVANPILNYFDAQKKDKANLNSIREMNAVENLYFDPTKYRGDWDQEGIFRPDELGFDSKGQFTNTTYGPTTYAQDGGTMLNDTNMQKIRIRITGMPQEQMAYGGQSNYGLDLGQNNVYDTMSNLRSDSISNTIKEVPREEANIEAEGGETVYGDLDGDGGLEHSKIVGNRHTQGGVPLKVPEGSFIFSDTKKMKIKDSEVLKAFGLNAKSGGYTPAEIAKRYDINKYKAVLEDQYTDDMSKATAQLMIKNYQKKLGMLAVIQEAMKGFPQGIPEVAESVMNGGSQMQGGEEGEEIQDEEMAYGGDIPKYQGGSQAGGSRINSTFEFLSPFTKELVSKINAEQDLKRRKEAAAKPTPNLVMNPNGSYYYSKTQGDPEMLYNTATGQRAPVTDSEYPKYMDLLKKYNSRNKPGQSYINNVSAADAGELSRLATKFGFKRDAEGTTPGYRVIQGSTPGLTFPTKSTKSGIAGFFGGYSPELYERKVVEDSLGADATAKLTPLELRKTFFKEIGVDITGISDTKLADTKKLYTDKNFFEKSFYPKFTERFASDSYRPEMKDDMYIGAEHYDAFKSRPKEAGVPVTGYVCQEGPNGRTVVPSSFMDEQARISAGAYASADEAEKVCSTKPTQGKKGWRCLGVLPDGKPNLVYDEIGTFTSQDEAAKTCVGGDKEIFDYMTPDKNTFWAAAQLPPKKYLPYRKNVPFEPGNVVFEDWRAKAAQRFANQYAAPSEQLAAYTGPQGLASNMSFLAGQAGEGIGQDIAQVDSRNVATANAFGSQERQRKDQYNLLNAMNAQDYYKDYVTTNQQFDNANRAYINNLVKAGNNAWNNRMNLGMLNAVNPVYKVDPRTGKSNFTKGNTTGKFPGYATANTGQKAIDFPQLTSEFMADKGASNMTFEQWYKLKYGAASNGVANPYAAAQQLVPMYNVLQQGNAYSPEMMQQAMQMIMEQQRERGI